MEIKIPDKLKKMTADELYEALILVSKEVGFGKVCILWEYHRRAVELEKLQSKIPKEQE